jgi:hypothetical protein
VFALLYLIAWWAIGRGTGHPPALLEGQQIEMRGHPMSDTQWTATLRRRFPPGSSETRLLSVLHGQGFWIDRQQRIAAYSWQEPLCRISVMVDWKTGPDKRITSIDGASAGMCL